MPLSTDFPAAGYLSDAARTQQEAKDAFESWLQATKELVGAGGAWPTLTIAGGAIAPTSGQALVDTEAGGATDELTTIGQATLENGRLLLLRSVASARVVTLVHGAGGAGQLALGDAVNLALLDPTMAILLRRNGAQWDEVGRFYGNQKAAARVAVGLSMLPVARGAALLAVANVVQITTDGDYFHVDPTVTTLNGISLTGALTGTRVTLVFDAACTVIHSAGLQLQGLRDRTTGAGDAVQFTHDGGGVWRESASGGALVGAVTEYTTPGLSTWIRPTGITRVAISAVGGGGGGRTGVTTGGGGASGMAIVRYLATVSGNLTVVVGAGGLVDGGTGGDTTITGTGVALTALGGGGARNQAAPNGGVGVGEESPASHPGHHGGSGGQAGISGTSGANCLAYAGGAGGIGAEGGGGGAASFFAAGGAGGLNTPAVVGTRGSGGGGTRASSAAAGGPGYVRIEVVG